MSECQWITHTHIYHRFDLRSNYTFQGFFCNNDHWDAVSNATWFLYFVF